MCYIALVKNNPSGQAGKAILNKIADKLDMNDDGAFVGSLSVAESLRTLDNKLAEETIKNMAVDNLLVHFRMATTGAINVDNVQGWEFGGWTCVHNGTVGGYNSGGLLEVESDSLKFFKKLCGKLPSDLDSKRIKKAIRKICYDERFNGRAILYNRLLDIAVIFGDWHLYEYGGAVIFSSGYLYDLGQKLLKKHNGFLFEYAEGLPLGESKIDGIYIMDNASQPVWAIRKIGKLREPKSEYSGYQGYQEYSYAPALTPIKPYVEPIQKILPLEQAVNELNKSCKVAEVAGLIRPIKDGEVVGYDLGGNAIEADEQTGVHLVNGACCMAGTCAEVWEMLEPSVADNLIRCGIPYEGKLLDNKVSY
jgi:hypothetical protein